MVNIFCFSALGLSGCGGYNHARLGVQSEPKFVGETQQQVQQEFSRSEKFIEWAGYLGKQTGYISGGIFGGIIGVCVDGLYVLSNGNNIDPSVSRMATTYNLASYGAKFLGTGGNYACTGVAAGLVWITPHVFNSTKWIACTSCNRVKCACASIYDYYTQTADVSDDNSDNREPNISTYEVHIGDNPEPFTVLAYKDHDFDNDSAFESGDDADIDEYFDAKE
ncbi:hypothetical protein [Cardinium endosymbiont of Encarsia pergandiella]|uniref:hypothetical protein n=1 Tax=Cardinium endosymbiont of Encarsia pergandiella TaxID=249402 RepID=UPI0004AEBB68|nr:hypothetical protein [Cardinium endosymbiont of Encarsia pergandiella]